MQNQTPDGLTKEHLQRKKQVLTFALYAVWIGAAVGMIASFLYFLSHSRIEKTTFIFSLIALIASYPVFNERKSISALLRESEVG